MTYNTRAIVLNIKPWPRQACLYTLYSEKFGKIRAVAAGTQKINSKVAGHLQPFSLTEVMIARGRNIDRLAQARTEQIYSGFYKNIDYFLNGTYILEVIDKLSDEGLADERVWTGIENIFSLLDQKASWGGDEKHIGFLVHIFAMQVLGYLGYKPECNRCVYCQNTVKIDNLFFSVLGGGICCANCRTLHAEVKRISLNIWRFIKFIFEKSLNELAKIIVSEDDKLVIEQIIESFLSVHIEKPIKTNILIQNVQNDKNIV